jgi:anthraniloyl-CoA monooxygenase
LRIAVIGGGPAGLYFAILMKLADPAHQVALYERNRPDDTFGWGVVFSDQTLDALGQADAETHRQITDSFEHWDDIDVHIRGRVITSGGHGFCGIARTKLLGILQARAAALGVELHFDHPVEDPATLGPADLIVVADGVHSGIRARHAEHFAPDIELRQNRFIWLGTTRRFDAFTFDFVESEWGWFQAHAYRFEPDTSTFIVETREESWRAAGLNDADTAASIAFCERLFAERLEGHRLMAKPGHRRGSAWIRFPRVANRRWSKGNLVLLGDAAHTAHFSIGSGTKLALEDAIALARAVGAERDLPTALAAYEAERRVEVLKLQSAARNSTEWFENVGRYATLPPEQFAYSLLTRSQRLGHENLRTRDKGYIAGVETWLTDHSNKPSPAWRERVASVSEPGEGERSGSAQQLLRAHPPSPASLALSTLSRQAGEGKTAVPPMFLPFRLRGMDLHNRVVVSPMATYSAEDGLPGDFHLVHLGARAMGGAGLVFTEMTCVTPEGRITPGCTGIWTDQQATAWRRITDFVHAQSTAKICLQLGHSGPKGSTKLGWEGMDQPLDAGNWPLLAPSPIAWSPGNQRPRAITRDEMDQIRDAFAAATRRAVPAGFDMVELHAAHGYLLSAFLSPLTNQREDGYGGSLANRLRFPLEVFRAMRAAWPEERPISVRISATDWVPGGVTAEDSVEIARAFKRAGADLIDVSAGQTSIKAQPVYGRMFQTPFADRIRNEVGIATMAVGNITDWDQINGIIAAGRADLAALARPHLADPNFTLHAAAAQGYRAQAWPLPYLAGKAQLERAQDKAAAETPI